MPRFNANLNITTGRGDTLSASKQGNYEDILNIRQKVDNTTSGMIIISASGSKGSATLQDAKSLVIKNTGSVGAEIKIASLTHANGTPDTTGATAYQVYLIGAGDFIYLPNIRQMYNSGGYSTGDAYQISNDAVTALYRALNNAASGDPQLLNEAVDSGAETDIDVDEGAYFYEGDLIRLEDEICEVVSISSNTLTVIRGTHGSTKATHAEDVAIRLPFFNNLADFDKYSTPQTDSNGQFVATNFFGYARNTDGSGNRESNGVVAGSFAIKFYKAGYQELGLSNITSATKSGLAVSTTYQFNITADGGSAFALSFTTDSSDVTFGGTNGIIAKIQDALNTAFYTAGNLFEKKVTVSIVKGDIRFTSGQHLSTSAILLADSSGGDTDIWGVGRFTAVADVEAPVAAKLPPDSFADKKSGLTVKNTSVFGYDDGFGNIIGACNGTINYETGAVSLKNCPPNANFVITANYGSSQSGGNRFTTDDGNCITAISGRSINAKVDTTIEIIGLQ